MRIKLTPSDDDDVGVVAEQSWLTGSERQQRVNTQQGPPWPCASCKKKPAIKPRLTRCLHVVCYECLELHVRGGDGALICPECGSVGTAEDAGKGFQPPESLPRIPQVARAENIGGSVELARRWGNGRECTAHDGSDLGGTAWTGAGMVDEDSGTGSSRAGTEAHHSSNEDVTGDNECSLCDEPAGTAHWYCTDCSPAVYLCRAHHNSHAQTGRRTAGHTVTPIHRATGDLVTVTLCPGSADLEVHSELSTEQLQVYATEDAVSEAEERNCTLHRTRALSSVCLTCNVLLCELCNATSDHARHDHSVLSLAQAAEARRRGMTSSIFRTVSSDDSMTSLDGSMASLSSSSSSRGAGDPIMNTGNGRLSTERRGLYVPDTDEILTSLLAQNRTDMQQVKENVSAVRQQTSQFYQRLLEAVQRRQRQTEDTVEDFMRAELSRLERQRQEIVNGVAASRRVASIADAMVSAAAHDADFLTASPWLKQAVEAGHGKVRALEKRGVRPRTLGFVGDHDITQHVLTSGILAAARVDKRAARDPTPSATATGTFPMPSPRSGQRDGSGREQTKAAPQPAELLAAECTVPPSNSSNSSNSSGGGGGSSIGEEGSDFRRVSCSLSTSDMDVQITLSLSMRSDIDTLLEGNIAPLDPNAISLDIVELSGRTTRLSAAQLSPVRLQSSAPPPRQSKFDFRAEYTAGGAAAFAETKATGASPGNNPCSFAKLAESSADTARGSTAAKGSAKGKALATATVKAQPLSIPLMSQADGVSTTLSPAKHSVSTTFPSPSTPHFIAGTSTSPVRHGPHRTAIRCGATAVTKTTPATNPAVAKTTPTSATAAAT
eukprot:scpid53154/ scgid34594/ 